MGAKRDYRCVQCGYPIKTLYIQYSPGNIRLMKCQNCKAVADEYIECEFMILVIDLILHKEKAYRHLFFNMFSGETLSIEGLLWKLTLGFLLLDIYRIFILSGNEGDWRLFSNATSLFWCCGKILVDVLLGNVLLFGILLLGTRSLLNAAVRVGGSEEIVLAILVSSYFKMFLMAMMVWEFPSSVIFIIDIFVLSSNTVALKVITKSSTSRCLGACLCAHAVKFLVNLGLNINPSKLVI